MIPVYLTNSGECIRVEADSPETALKTLRTHDAAVVIRRHPSASGKPYEAMRYECDADAWVSYPADTAEKAMAAAKRHADRITAHQRESRH